MTSSALTGNTSGLASATSPGLVGTSTQTFAGNKTLTGLVTASGGIINTGLTGANATTVNTNGSGKVGEVIPLTNRAVTTVTAGVWAGNSTALATLASGIWLICGFFSVSTTASLTNAAAAIDTNFTGSPSGIAGQQQHWCGNNPATLIFGGAITPFVIVASGSTPIYAKSATLGTVGSIVAVTGTAIRIA
jgi:hypothetical protein